MDGFPSKWKFTELLAHLDADRSCFEPNSSILNDKSPGAVQNYIMPRIERLIRLTLMAVEPRMFIFS